jgi:tetratricopeptide (TPR) repeat protein/O-antigen ligase
VADRISRVALYGLLLWPALAAGAYRDWPLAVVQLLALVALVALAVAMLRRRRLEWRSTAIDAPLVLLISYVGVQLLLGNRPLATWALAPPAAAGDGPVAFPGRLWTLGTVSPPLTARALLLLLTYAAAYLLVVNLVRDRQALDRLVRTVLVFGGIVAFLGLADYLAGDAWLLGWRETRLGGRLSGTFPNPDHFAAWLTMLVPLGLGYLMARRRRGSGPASLAALFRSSHEGRERLIRLYLPSVAVGVTMLALIFTLSRGGLLSLMATLLGLAAMLRALRVPRSGPIVMSGLVAVTLGYAAWIGLDPLWQRAESGPADLASRWVQYRTTLSMVPAFPLWGVGLGAYRDIYPRYQPFALQPGVISYQYAHSDLLQLVIELGLAGALIVAFLAWRVARDLLGAHLLAWGRCPVGGGEGEEARRHDPFSVGIGLGALGGVCALLVHSAVDFSARIPANGLLAAICLGMATVALHTRFGDTAELLTDVRSVSMRRGAWVLVLAGGSVVTGALLVAFVVVRAAIAEAALRSASAPTAATLERAFIVAPTEAALEGAFKVHARDSGLLSARGGTRLETAASIWRWGLTEKGLPIGSREEQADEVRRLLHGARDDLRSALALRPAVAGIHERLGWTHGLLALVENEDRDVHRALALSHLERAVALFPENPFLHRSLAALAATPPAPRLEVALRAGREAIRREPELLDELVVRLRPVGPSPMQWLALVPEAWTDRLHLGVLLASGGLLSEAQTAYRGAIGVAGPEAEPLCRWMLAGLLIQAGDLADARREVDLALRLDPDNPELHLTRARVLAANRDPAALAAHRLAVTSAGSERGTLRARQGAGSDGDVRPFAVSSPRVDALLTGLLGQNGRVAAGRYRRALAEYLMGRRMWEQAVPEWNAILAEAPEDAAAHFARGVALEHLGAGDQALESFSKAVSLDGDAVRFRQRLAERLWLADRYVEAVEEWRRVSTLDPQASEAHAALARALIRLGDRIAAFQEYQAVLRIAPDHPDARRGFVAFVASPPVSSHSRR